MIMGIYNCAKTLPRAIDSILSQTYTNWELIMCDDGSSDDTYRIAREYVNRFENKIILLVNSRNMGLAYSLNECLKKATGDYIARMDADDISLTYRFEHQVYYLNQHPLIAVVGGGIIPFSGNTERKIRLADENPTKYSLLKGVPFYHPTIMMRKSIYDELDGYTNSKRTIKGQDLDLWFRFYAAGYKGYNLQKPLLKYHEDIEDYKRKRTVKAGFAIMKTMWIGFRLLKFPIYKHIYVFRPLISAMLPRRLIYCYHNMKHKASDL